MLSLKEAKSWRTETDELLSDFDSGDNPVQNIFEGVRIGQVLDVTDEGILIVGFDGVNRGRIPARSITPITPADRGRSALLVFEKNDLGRPIIVGLLQHIPSGKKEAPKEINLFGGRPSEAKVDSERVVIDAKREISLRCGKSSITLHTDGKIVIRGTKLLSRSSGVNKIKGASIEIN